MVLMEISPCGEGARAGKKEEVKHKFEFVLEVRVEVMISCKTAFYHNSTRCTLAHRPLIVNRVSIAHELLAPHLSDCIPQNILI